MRGWEFLLGEYMYPFETDVVLRRQILRYDLGYEKASAQADQNLLLSTWGFYIP